MLRSRWTWLLARLALASPYLIGGVTKLANIPAAVAEQAHFGLHPAALWAALTIVTELGGSVLLVSGRLVWLGAGVLGIFTALAAIIANDFWVMQPGPARFIAMNSFFEHVGLVAAFVLMARLAALEARQAA